MDQQLIIQPLSVSIRRVTIKRAVARLSNSKAISISLRNNRVHGHVHVVLDAGRKSLLCSYAPMLLLPAYKLISSATHVRCPLYYRTYMYRSPCGRLCHLPRKQWFTRVWFVIHFGAGMYDADEEPFITFVPQEYCAPSEEFAIFRICHAIVLCFGN